MIERKLRTVELWNYATKNYNILVFWRSFIVLSSIVLSSPFLFAATTLPIEVLGPDGHTESVTVTVPSGQSGLINGLWMQINNLSYPNALVSYAKASVQINNGPWTDLTNATVQVQGLAKVWEGIGGPYNTIKMILPVTSGAVVDGNNTINFRFNKTDGVSAGYRVINFYFANGTNQVTATLPSDDPSQWTAPAGGNAANGKVLWNQTKILTNPVPGDAPVKIGASCSNCHATDGGDLKYFNYSNKSIEARAVFHGLIDPQEGEDLAAYIRGLTTYRSVNGRPWNPVYQPGPGLDSQPIQEWAAGAGINAVLEDDQAILPYLFPNGISEAAISATTLPPVEHNIREIPTAMQYLDWNHWLPRVYPGDSWTDFEGSVVYADFYGAGGLLSYVQNPGSGDINTIVNKLNKFDSEQGTDLFGYENSKIPGSWTNASSEQAYSLAQWGTVKNWELMNELNLQGQASSVSSLQPQLPQQNGYNNSIAEPRSWYTGAVFTNSPHFLHIPRDSTGIIDTVNSLFLSDFWYRMAVTLYTDRNNVGHWPLDWSYTFGFLTNNTQQTSNSPNIMQFLSLFIKTEEMQNNGWAPNMPASSESVGWLPSGQYGFDVSYLVNAANGYPINPTATNPNTGWANTPAATRQALCQAFLGAWLDKSTTYPVSDYTNGNADGPLVTNPNLSVFAEDGQLIEGEFGERIWGMVPYFRAMGVSETLLQSVINWGQQLYPNGPWAIVRDTSIKSDPSISYNAVDPNGMTVAPGNFNFQAYWSSKGPIPANAPPFALYVNNVRIGTGTPDPKNAGWTDFSWPATTAGTYTVQVRADFPVGSIGGAAVPITVNGNSVPPPTVATPASANPNPVTGTTTNLSVLGADTSANGGESNLNYTWALTGSPPAVVAFSINGTNQSKKTTATFTRAGTYGFQVTIKNATSNLTAVSVTTVTVNQTMTAVSVSPPVAGVTVNGTQTFSAIGFDQFNQAVSPPPTFAWNVSGGGSITSSGQFVAGNTLGTFTVTATSGGKSGTASVTVTNSTNPPPVVTNAAFATPNPVGLSGDNNAALSVMGNDPGGTASDLTYTWFTSGGVAAGVSFSINGTNNANNTLATFFAAGIYTLNVVLREPGGLTATSSVKVTVDSALMNVVVSPPVAVAFIGSTQLFAAQAFDQFNQALSQQPTFTWTAPSGAGTLASDGTLTAANTPGGPFTLTATTPGGKTGTALVLIIGDETIGGPLPAPDLSGYDGKTLTVQDQISLVYNNPITKFLWSVTPESASGGSPGIGTMAQTSAVSGYSTSAPELKLAPLTLDPGNYVLTAQAQNGFLNSPTSTAHITLVEADLSDVQIYPNPWRSDKHGAYPKITFNQLALNSTIKIFTVSGHLVKTISPSGATANWDLTTDSGDKAASGIYIYLITDGQGNKVHGKLALIR